MTRPAPVGPQLAPFLSTAVEAAKSAATNRRKSEQPATSKLPAQFSSLLGRLVEKKEKSSAKPAETVAVPFAGSPLTPPPPPKQESPARGPVAFGLGESGGDPLPNNLQPQTSLDGVQPLLTVPGLSAPAPTSVVATKPVPNSRPLSISQLAVSPLNVQRNVASPGVSLAQQEPADSDFSIHDSSTSETQETPASPSLVALLGNGFAPVTAASDATLQIGSQDGSVAECSSESSTQPSTDSGLPRSQLISSVGGVEGLVEKGAAGFQPNLTEKPVLPKAKIGAGGLREQFAQMIDPGSKYATSPQAQSQEGELESGMSGGNRGAKETSAHSEQSQNADAPQSKPGEPPRPGSLAFAARLVPLLPETPAIGGTPGGSAQSTSAGPTGQGEAAQVSKDSVKSGPPADAQPAATPSSSPSGLMPSVPQMAAGHVQNNSSSETRGGNNNSSPLPAAKDVQAAEPATGVQLAAPSSARDIHLQLNQGEHRVDVRLSERGGEVHVAVRTPDPQLAGALRDDLPRLSDHLEASGFRAETWHTGLPGTLSGGERHLEAAESSFSQPQDGGQRQAGERDPQQQQQPRQPKPGTAQNSNSQRKDFQWLMSQLP